MHTKQIEHFYPLSPMQQGMLFHTLYAPNSGVYFEQITCTLHGELDESAFQHAWQTTVDRHPILRTMFVWEDLDEPVQAVRPDVRVPLARHDWRGLRQDDQSARLAAYLQDERDCGFDLTVAPLLRLALFQIAQVTYQFVWSFHHLLLDGWSIPLVFQDVFACYEALVQGREVQLAARRPYRDYIVWLRRRDLAAAEAFWRRVLEGFAAPTPLGVDIAARSAAGVEDRHIEQQLQLSAVTTAALHAFVRQQQLTLNILVQGAWALLLSRYSGEQDLVFGVTVSGRPPDLVGSEAMVGLFINTLPVRVQVTRCDSLLPWLTRLHAQQVELRQYEYSSLVQIQGWSAVPKRLPLFESILVFENYPIDAAVQQRGSNLAIQDVRSVEQSNYPLTVVAVQGARLTLRIGYDPQRFEPATITRMLGHLQAVLEDIVANPQRCLADISILTAQERRQLLAEWNATQADYPKDAYTHELIDACARRTPDAVAVVFDGRTTNDERRTTNDDDPLTRSSAHSFDPQCLTYGELSRRTNQLARHLRSLGVGPEVRVAICVERSLELGIGVLGILKADGAYVPIDPAYPQEHLAFMLADAQARVLLTTNDERPTTDDQRPQSLIPNPQSPIPVYLDADWPTIARQPGTSLDGDVAPDNLAYVIYTSGSTGRPKGVMISHRAMLNLTIAFCDQLGLRAGYPFLMVPSLSFDASVGDIFPALFSGGTLVLHRAPAELAGQDLLRLCEQQRIAILDIPAAFWVQWVHDLAESPRADMLSSLKLIIVGGESISIDRLRTWTDLTARRAAFFGPYGPTEATVCTTSYKLPSGAEPPIGSKLPIGRPIANAQVYLLDAQLQPVPIGVAGELYIGGAGLARGYLKRPDLTAERFLPNPFAIGDWGLGIGDWGTKETRRQGDKETRRQGNDESTTQNSKLKTQNLRLYRTGDLARYLPDGNIEFLGRADHQVKVRGYRIELGEIEAALLQHPAVRESAVILREDTPSNKRLVAYLVPKIEDRGLKIEDSQADAPEMLSSIFYPLSSDLRRFLKERLPDYMVPAAFVPLEAMPITSNGKVDRHALPASEGLRPELETEYEAPRNEVERMIAAVWQTVLQVDKVGVHDNFFDLGGHSLLMIQAHGKLREVLRSDLSLIELFKYPSIHALTRYISQEQSRVRASDHDNLADKLEAGKNRLKQQLQQKQRTTSEPRSNNE